MKIFTKPSRACFAVRFLIPEVRIRKEAESGLVIKTTLLRPFDIYHTKNQSNSGHGEEFES